MCWPLVGNHIFTWSASSTGSNWEPVVPHGLPCECGKYKMSYGQLVPVEWPEYEGP